MESFERFYDSQHDPVLAMLYAMVGDWSTAEDLTQEAFARAFRRWRQVSRYERPDSWIRTVAANLARSRHRRREVERRNEPRLAAPPHAVDDDPIPDELARFWAAVRALPRQQSLAITLHYLEDRSPTEIAEILGCAPATARVHLHRARHRLQHLLALVDAKDPS